VRVFALNYHAELGFSKIDGSCVSVDDDVRDDTAFGSGFLDSSRQLRESRQLICVIGAIGG